MIPARGGWVVQSVRHVTLSLSLDIDLRVMSSSVTLGPMLGMEPAFKKKRGGRGGKRMSRPSEVQEFWGSLKRRMNMFSLKS